VLLRSIVLLVLLALLARRFWPRSRLSWAVPLVLVGVIVVVRTVGYLAGDQVSADDAMQVLTARSEVRSS
jgi:hypothetical protein